MNSADPAIGSSRRILVIDNEANIREVVQACLSDLGGWEVLGVASGQEGLAKAATEAFDAIVLDPLALEMDSVLFLQQLRNNPLTHKIPLIVLTARVHTVQPRKLSQFGVMEAIAKPFNPVTLPQQIAIALGWQQVVVQV
jgi:CheY-like chemotaxis protein